jgi:hypothetical protein
LGAVDASTCLRHGLSSSRAPAHLISELVPCAAQRGPIECSSMLVGGRQYRPQLPQCAMTHGHSQLVGRTAIMTWSTSVLPSKIPWSASSQLHTPQASGWAMQVGDWEWEAVSLRHTLEPRPRRLIVLSTPRCRMDHGNTSRTCRASTARSIRRIVDWRLVVAQSNHDKEHEGKAHPHSTTWKLDGSAVTVL